MVLSVQELINRMMAAQAIAKGARRAIWRYGDVGDSEDEKH